MSEVKNKAGFDDARDIKALREELMLQAHLFRAEAKDRYEALERRWREAQRIVHELEGRSDTLARELKTAASTTIDELAEQYRLLKSELARRK